MTLGNSADDEKQCGYDDQEGGGCMQPRLVRIYRTNSLCPPFPAGDRPVQASSLPPHAGRRLSRITHHEAMCKGALLVPIGSILIFPRHSGHFS